MKRPDTIIIEGRAYSWRALVALRKAQLYYTNGKDYRPAWAHCLRPIEVMVSGWATRRFQASQPASRMSS